MGGELWERAWRERMKSLTVDQIMKEVTLTVTVKVPAGYKFKMTLSTFLIRLAAKILGCRLEIAEAK